MGCHGYTTLRLEMKSRQTQLIQREVLHINMTRTLETAATFPDILPRSCIRNSAVAVHMCRAKKTRTWCLTRENADIKATGSKKLSDGRQFRAAPPNSQPYTACCWRRKQRLQCNQESILLLKRISEQYAPESQVSIHDSEAKATDGSFLCADDSFKLAARGEQPQLSAPNPWTPKPKKNVGSSRGLFC